MSLAETTLSSAVAINDTSIKVASATSMAEGRLIEIDGEKMKATKAYVTSSTTVPVIRGLDGSAQLAHPASARVIHGEPSDFGDPGAGTLSTSAPAGRPTKRVSISATGSLTLPQPGENLLVVLNGASAITLTMAVPTKDLDGCELTFVANGAAAHVLTFTGGLGGAGSGYTTVTMNGTKPVAFRAIACNEVWIGLVGIPAAGTVTNVTATVA